ncbi:MAG: tetratricopeptide repeat protein [Sphingobacteriaceae bacterium]|nr:tetratricopeptide repeat protein [Sphingobacteriaceae bacterium]
MPRLYSKVILFFLVLALYPQLGKSDNYIDSLKKIITGKSHDSLKMDALDDLVQALWKTDTKQALNYSKLYLATTIKSKEEDRIAGSLNLLAGTYYFLGDYKNSLLYNIKTLQQRKKIRADGKTVGSKKSIASSHINIAGLYLNQGNYSLAIEHNLEALKLKRETKDSVGEARVLSNLGNAYESMGNDEKAISFHESALQLANQIGEEYIAGSCYNNLGNIYTNLNKYDKAFRSYEKAIEFRKKINDEEGLYGTYNNVGNLYFELKKYDEAKKYFELVWEYYHNSSDPLIKTSVLVNMGVVYKHFKEMDKAEKYLNQAIIIAKENKLLQIEKNAYESLAQMFSGKKDFAKAYQYMKLYAHINDTIFKVENSRKIAELQAKYDDAFKTNQLENMQKANMKAELENSRKELELQRQTGIRNISFMAIGLLLIIGILFLNRYSIKNKLNEQLAIQNKQIAEKNLDITNSITYAKRIQNAIVPSEKSVSAIFPDNFIMYRPKDIVAGDFYWCEVYENKKYIAVADCTGHGVPGAMMSVVCSNALNRSLFEFKITEPGNLLDKTRDLILETFSKNEEQMNDGMDISLLCVDGNEVKWAGANNSLIYFSKGKRVEIKSHKQSIGKTDKITPFPTHPIPLVKGDVFYLYSDGYADQFGGENGKKIILKNMLALFENNHQLPFQEQKSIITKYFDDWKGNLEQVDDVCLIGIRV